MRPAGSRIDVTSSHTALVLLVVGIGLAGGCARPLRGTSMWIAEAVPTSPQGESPAISDPRVALRSERISLRGAANETLSFRFGLETNGSPLMGPILRTSPMVGSAGVAGTGIELYRMHRVRLDRFPGWHVRSILPSGRDGAPWDVLVPLDAPRGGMPRQLQPGEALYFWADVSIPKDVPEGTYTSRIDLLSSDTLVSTINIELTVLPIVLPDAGAIPVLADVDHVPLLWPDSSKREVGPGPWRESPRRADWESRVRYTMHLLYNHGLTAVLPKLAPSVKSDAYGRAAIDWQDYDALLSAVDPGSAESGVSHRLWPLPFDAVLRGERQFGRDASPTYVGLLRDYFRQTARHFAEMGRLEKCYAMLPDLDVNSVTSIESVRRLAGLARSADGRIPVAMRFWPQDMRPYGWVDYPIEALADIGGGGQGPDIWVTPAQFFAAERMATERDAGRETWLMVDRPPFSGSLSIFAPPTYTRVLPWQAERLGASVLYLGCVNCWPRSEQAPRPDKCVRADPNVLLYPGEPFGLSGPVASVRLKELRQGIRDLRYRQALTSRGLEYLRKVVVRALVAYAGTSAYRAHFEDGKPIGWVDDPAVFELARTVMADALVHAHQEGRSQGKEQEFTSTANWRRFVLATSRTRFSIEGTRLRLEDAPTLPTAELEMTTTIVNRTRVPLSGSVGLERIPVTWTALEGLARFGPLQPGGSARVTLLARLPPDIIAPSGILHVPVELKLDDNSTARREARLAFATAIPLQNDRETSGAPVRIDGDLSDWPPGRLNVLSDFRLISADSETADVEAAGTPRHATTVLLMRDDAALYFAVNCEFDGRSGRVISRHNRVVYDDLVPVGEELVEILIDPFNAGTRSPSDLYHVAIKPSGAYLTERGIAMSPPCGTSRAWSAQIEVATAIRDDRWTAELRVPLSSFPDAAVQRTIWGLNVTRYDASRQEFSTWSGAQRNAYDPLSLGNLYLP